MKDFKCAKLIFWLAKYRMNLLYLILFGIFAFQCRISFTKLLDVPIITNTEPASLTDVDGKIVITICPTNQWNLTALHSYGYLSTYDFFLGLTENSPNISSWGEHANVTFEELVKEVLTSDLLGNIFTLESKATTMISNDNYERRKVLFPQTKFNNP